MDIKMNDLNSNSALTKISLVYTSLQQNILKSIIGEKYNSHIVLYPQDRHRLNTGHETPVITNDYKLTIVAARKLVLEVYEIVEKCIGSAEFEVWLASCDSPIGQILANHPQCARVVLIEDGIGSYVAHSFLDRKLGLRSLLRKIKYIVYLFPHYRSMYGIGSIDADESWAIYDSAFPRGRSKPNLVDKESLRRQFSQQKVKHEIAADDVLFLEQALTRTIAKDVYEELICDYLALLEATKKPSRYIIKPHPTSTIKEIEDAVALFKRNTEKPIIVVDSSIPIESLVLSFVTYPSEIFSVISSALYTIFFLNKNINLKSISSKKLLREAPYFKNYISVLSEIGVDCVHFN